MTDQSSLEALRRRLVDVLRERLSELEDDEARQANWEATNWDLLVEVLCKQCGQETLRIIKGLCVSCHHKQQERAYQTDDRLSKVLKRYPRLTRGLKRKLVRGKGVR